MTTRSAFRLFVLAAACLSACDRAPEAAAPRTTFAVPANWPHSLSAPDVTATHGIVVSDAPLASRVGVDVLRSGGSAVDAAIATGSR